MGMHARLALRKIRGTLCTDTTTAEEEVFKLNQTLIVSSFTAHVEPV